MSIPEFLSSLMFGGAYYIWIMLTFFLGCGGLLLLLGGIFFVGHWFEKKRTGAKHGFLELPDELGPENKSVTPPGGDAPPPPAER